MNPSHRKAARPRVGHPRKSPMRDYACSIAVLGHFRGDSDSGDSEAPDKWLRLPAYAGMSRREASARLGCPLLALDWQEQVLHAKWGVDQRLLRQVAQQRL